MESEFILIVIILLLIVIIVFQKRKTSKMKQRFIDILRQRDEEIDRLSK